MFSIISSFLILSFYLKTILIYKFIDADSVLILSQRSILFNRNDTMIKMPFSVFQHLRMIMKTMSKRYIRYQTLVMSFGH